MDQNDNDELTPATAREKLADHRAYVEVHQIVCRECDYSTGTPTGDQEAVYAAHNEHFNQSGHNRFWKYTISRSNGRIARNISDL
jgi:hypothetical protein